MVVVRVCWTDLLPYMHYIFAFSFLFLVFNDLIAIYELYMLTNSSHRYPQGLRPADEPGPRQREGNHAW